MSDTTDTQFEEELRQINEIFGDTNFTISIGLEHMDDLITDRTCIVIKSDYKCYCYDANPRPSDYFIILNDRITIKHVLLELKEQHLCLECNHHFIEGFQKDSDCQYSLIIGS